jgi:3-amino-5-hydroxybenzoate synthase
MTWRSVPATARVSDVLAADGGARVRSKPFPAWPIVDDAVRDALRDVVESGHWWQADWRTGRVEELEHFLADRFGSTACVAVMNGTAALELAFAALGLGPGDEVLVPAVTFISTATAVSSVGATPVPVDVERDTLLIDVEDATLALTPRTRAVVPVHLAGELADLDVLQEFAHARSLHIVEDAAQAFGTRRAGRSLGVTGALTTLSFQAGKLLPGGEGGAILVRDSAVLAERLFQLSHCGTTRGSAWYAHTTIGSNRRMTEFQAAAVLAQAPLAPARAGQRVEAARLLAEGIVAAGAGTPTRRPPGTNPADPSSFWFWLPPDVVGLADAHEVARLRCAEGVPTAPMYPPWHRTRAYGGQGRVDPRQDRPTPVATSAGAEVVWFHHRLLLDGREGVDDIVHAVTKVMDAVRRRRRG